MEKDHFPTHESPTSHFTVSLNHPRLLTLDPASIRVFLRDYDAYSRTVQARAKQLTSSSEEPTITTEAVKAVDLKYCVDTQLLTSTISLGFIPTIT